MIIRILGLENCKWRGIITIASICQVCYMPNSFKYLSIWTHLLLTMTLSWYYFPHFTEETNEVTKGLRNLANILIIAVETLRFESKRSHSRAASLNHKLHTPKLLNRVGIENQVERECRGWQSHDTTRSPSKPKVDINNFASVLEFFT